MKWNILPGDGIPAGPRPVLLCVKNESVCYVCVGSYVRRGELELNLEQDPTPGNDWYDEKTETWYTAEGWYHDECRFCEARWSIDGTPLSWAEIEMPKIGGGK